MAGWIKLHRKILDNPTVCQNPDFLAVWIYLLLNATHSEIKVIFNGNEISLMPGQLITGRKTISEIMKVEESKVQRILKKLENAHQIEQQTSTKNRLITILNWESYQQSEQQNEQQVNNKRTTSEQQVNTNKNVKKEHNVKNEKKDIYFDDINLNDVFIDFVDMRKKLKSPMSDRAIKMMIKKINDYDVSVAIELLEDSILHSWKDIYPKDKPKRQEQQEERKTGQCLDFNDLNKVKERFQL